MSAAGDAGDDAIVDVAVGVLIDERGRFLLTSRPAGKVYAGWWEFPGGKLEGGESVVAALALCALYTLAAMRIEQPS